MEGRQGCATDAAFERLDKSGQPAELISLVKECLEKEPGQRPSSATVVAERVIGYLANVQEKLQAAEVNRARSEAKAVEERKKRRWQLGLVVSLLSFLTISVVVGMWIQYEQEWNRQETIRIDRERIAEKNAAREKAETATKQELKEAHQQMQAGRNAAAPALLATFAEAIASAHRAIELARRGPVSDELLREAEETLSKAENEVSATRLDMALLRELLNPSEILENIAVTRLRNPKGVNDPSNTDRKYADAFRAWGVDAEKDDLDIVANRIKARPPAVVEEVVAGIHMWAVYRRREVPKANALRLLNLANRIDPNERRNELRQFLAVSPLIPKTKSFGPSEDLLPGELEGERKKLADLTTAADSIQDPVLTIVLLAATLEAAGNSEAAEQLLRKAVTTRGTEPILLSQLAFMIMREVTSKFGTKSPDLSAIAGMMSKNGANSPLEAFSFLLTDKETTRMQEAVGFLRVVRAIRPESGLMLGFALLLTRQASEGETLLRQFNIQLQSPDLTAGLTFAQVLGLILQQKLDTAETILRGVISHPPIDGGSVGLFHDLLATVLIEKRKPKDAEQVYRNAVALFPNDYLINLHFGEFLIDQDRVEERSLASLNRRRMYLRIQRTIRADMQSPVPFCSSGTES